MVHNLLIPQQKIAAEPMGATNIFNFTVVKPISYMPSRVSIWGLGYKLVPPSFLAWGAFAWLLANFVARFGDFRAGKGADDWALE